jgi:GNAT superfamily N-acetyltransferase
MIRKANINDIDKLSVLFEKYRTFYEMDDNIEASVKFLMERISNQESEIFIFENETNDLLGFVQLYPIFSSTRLKRLWLLNDLFVDETSRGQGISISLIEKAQELAINTKSAGLILETAKTNVIGNQLYPKTGFIKDEEHNFYSWDC